MRRIVNDADRLLNDIDRLDIEHRRGGFRARSSTTVALPGGRSPCRTRNTTPTSGAAPTTKASAGSSAQK
jgi:hypothetical protein